MGAGPISVGLPHPVAPIGPPPGFGGHSLSCYDLRREDFRLSPGATVASASGVRNEEECALECDRHRDRSAGSHGLHRARGCLTFAYRLVENMEVARAMC